MSILFFKTPAGSVIATQADHRLDAEEIGKLCWLYGGATLEEGDTLDGFFVGPRREMITLGARMPWKSPRTWGFAGFRASRNTFP